MRQIRPDAKLVREFVPLFFKQWGGRTHNAGGRLLDGCTWDEMPERPLLTVSEQEVLV